MQYEKLAFLRLQYNQRFKHLLPARPFSKVKMLNAILIALKKATQDRTIPTMPSTLVFTNTQTCNLTCPFCFTHGNEAASKEYNDKNKNISRETFHKFAEEALPFADDVWLSLIGEGLHMPVQELERYVDYFNKYGNKLVVNTNATLLDNKRIQLLLPVTRLFRFSLDGASKHVFEAIRKGANFEKTIKSIKILTKTAELLPENLRPSFEVKLTICGSNIRELSKIVELCHVLNVKSIYSNFIVVDPAGGIPNEAVDKHRQLYNKCIIEASQRAKELNLQFIHPPLFKIDPMQSASVELPSEGMIIKNYDQSYYVKLEELLDINWVEQNATENAIAILATILDVEGTSLSGNNSSKALENNLKTCVIKKMQKHRSTLEWMHANPNETRTYCWSVDSYMDVRYDGDSRLCCNGSHITALLRNFPDAFGENGTDSNVITNGISGVFNGRTYSRLATSICESRPIDTACIGCEGLRTISNKELIQDLAAVYDNYFSTFP